MRRQAAHPEGHRRRDCSLARCLEDLDVKLFPPHHWPGSATAKARALHRSTTTWPVDGELLVGRAGEPTRIYYIDDVGAVYRR
jgi:hypothetical protein